MAAMYRIRSDERKRVVISRVINALARALLVAVLVALPSLTLPMVSMDSAQIALFVSFLAASFTFSEYFAKSPTIIEFRDAAPFNRMRYFMALLIVALLTAICFAKTDGGRLPDLVAAGAQVLGQSLDVPFSPVRLIIIAMPETTSTETLLTLRDGAAMAYGISLVGVAAFFVLVRFYDWPARNGAFNVWINLPLFDPTTGGDVVPRLRRDGYVNIIFGALLPFAMPAIVALTLNWFNMVSLLEGQSFVWSIAAWSFFPGSMMMRGIAMCRIAELIDAKRQRTYARAASDAA
ncbi:MAG: hypothetical protein MK098_12400 [Marinovum sp.]|nr:hypothetical protein [Marinovum sp.]